MIQDIIIGFILGLLFAASYVFFIRWFASPHCWEPNNKDMPSFEERIQRIKKFEEEKKKRENE
jgi:hypothetical protein